MRVRSDACTRGRAGEERKRERGRQRDKQKAEESWGGDKKEKSSATLLCLFWLGASFPRNNTRSGSQAELDEVKATQSKACKDAVKFADESPAPPATLAKELEFPDAPGTDYNLKTAPAVCAYACVRGCVCSCASEGTMGGQGETDPPSHDSSVDVTGD